MQLMRGIAPRLSLTRSSVRPPLPLHSLHRLHRLPLSSPTAIHSKHFSLSHSYRVLNMDDNVKQHYLADSPPSVVKLEIKAHWDTLKDESLKRYAHFMSRYGTCPRSA
jgi:dipeptidyl-peptidase-3